MKIKAIQVLAVVGICGMIFVGCSKEEDVKKPENKQSVMTNTQEYFKARAFIKDYFKELYKPDGDINDMHKRSYFGEVPENLHKFIDEGVIADGLNSPEIPIHLPRFIELNGYTIIGYNIIEKNGDPVVDSTVIEEEGLETKYFTKVEFLTKAIRNADFDLYYQKVVGQEYYNKVSEVPEDKIDNMKIRLKYDVVLNKVNGAYKIIAQTETNIKSDNKYRILKFNNAFVDKLSYLDLSLTNANKPVNLADTDKFKIESELIQGFFDNMLALDKSKMNYVQKAWLQDMNKFNEILEKYKLQRVTEGKSLLLIGDDYKTKFNIKSFLLQDAMVKINSKKSMDIKIHPSYTKKVNNYIVTINAEYQKMNGSSQDIGNATYIYDVGFSIRDNVMMISNINLVEFKIER